MKSLYKKNSVNTKLAVGPGKAGLFCVQYCLQLSDIPYVMSKPVNSNLGSESSFPVYVPLLTLLSALRAAWLVLKQQKQEMRSLNLNSS